MRRAKIAWRRARHVFVCVADGHGLFEAERFDAYFEDLSRMGFTHYLCVARGAPILSSRERRRTLALPGVTDVTLAIVYDGSPIARGLATIFAFFMPKTKLFDGDRLPEALDHLGLDGGTRDEVTRAVAELVHELAQRRAAASIAAGSSRPPPAA